MLGSLRPIYPVIGILLIACLSSCGQDLFDKYFTLGQSKLKQGRVSEAEVELKLAVRQSEHFSSSDIRQAQCRISLGKCYMAQGLYAEAEKILRQALEISKNNKEPKTLVENLNQLAGSLEMQKKYGEAIEHHTAALSCATKSYGKDNPITLALAGTLCDSLLIAGRKQDAERIYKQLLPLAEGKLGANNPGLIPILQGYAACTANKEASATLLARAQALAKSEKKLPASKRAALADGW